MGCVNTKKFADADNNVFKVSESKFGEGKLEINSKEMIFYRKGCEKIAFSLKHLRRYGVDLETNIFCFEAGRSCSTGEGIYPFKSLRASAMFDILKNYIESIDSSATNEEVLFNHFGEGLDHLDETLHSLRTQRASQSDGYETETAEPNRISNHRKAFQIRMSSVSGMSPQTIESSETPFLYENHFIENNNSIDAPSSSYVNVTATTPKSCKSVSFFEETIPRNYENLDIQEVPTEPPTNDINYTELELTQEEAVNHETPVKPAKTPVLMKSFSTGYNVEPLVSPQSRNSLPYNYAVIDFERTNALANSTGNSSTTTGARKTRHHSEDNFLFEKRRNRNVIIGV